MHDRAAATGRPARWRGSRRTRQPCAARRGSATCRSGGRSAEDGGQRGRPTGRGTDDHDADVVAPRTLGPLPGGRPAAAVRRTTAGSRRLQRTGDRPWLVGAGQAAGPQPVARVGDDADPAGDPQVPAQRRDVLRGTGQRVQGTDDVDGARGQDRLGVLGEQPADDDRGRPGAHDPLDGLDAAARPGRGRCSTAPGWCATTAASAAAAVVTSAATRKPGADSRSAGHACGPGCRRPRRRRAAVAASPAAGAPAPGCWPVIDIGATATLRSRVARRVPVRTALGHGSSVRVPNLRRIVPSAGGTASCRVRGSRARCRPRRCTLRSSTGTRRTRATCPGGPPGPAPWAVLVSEVMLQQTPVARVEPVYRAWLERWPLPADLAAEAPGEAVRTWGRLGYPRRALRLHAAAVEVVDAARRRAAGVVRRDCSRCPASGTTPRLPWRRSRTAPGTRCSTPTCGGCWPAPSGVRGSRRRPSSAVERARADALVRTSPRWRRGGQSR